MWCPWLKRTQTFDGVKLLIIISHFILALTGPFDGYIKAS